MARKKTQSEPGRDRDRERDEDRKEEADRERERIMIVYARVSDTQRWVLFCQTFTLTHKLRLRWTDLLSLLHAKPIDTITLSPQPPPPPNTHTLLPHSFPSSPRFSSKSQSQPQAESPLMEMILLERPQLAHSFTCLFVCLTGRARQLSVLPWFISRYYPSPLPPPPPPRKK